MAAGDLLASFSWQNGEPPASLAAVAAERGTTGILVLAFDDTTDEEMDFRFTMPRHYGGGGVTATVHWSAADTTVTPHNAVWQGAFKSAKDDADDMDTKTFAAFQTSGAVAEASVSGELSYDPIVFTDGAEMDSIAAGETGFFKLRRDADDTSGTDSLTDDAEMWTIELRETP